MGLKSIMLSEEQQEAVLQEQSNDNKASSVQIAQKLGPS